MHYPTYPSTAGHARSLPDTPARLLHNPTRPSTTGRASATARHARPHQAWHDELTGLGNRAQFVRRVDEAGRRYAETGADTAMLLLDLDGFKAVNDTLGHDSGDRLLCEITTRLPAAAPGATVCRHGGDEFVILTDRPVAEPADRLLLAVAAPAVLDGRSTRVGASIGVTFVSEAPTEPAELLRRADTAMYEVKSSGKNAWRLNTPAVPSPPA